MKCKFVVGQRVVLVDDKFHDANPADKFPLRDHAYTVRGFDFDLLSTPYIFLVEIVNQSRKYRDGTGEVCFRASRFRPAIDFQSLCDVKREERV